MCVVEMILDGGFLMCIRKRINQWKLKMYLEMKFVGGILKCIKEMILFSGNLICIKYVIRQWNFKVY